MFRIRALWLRLLICAVLSVFLGLFLNSMMLGIVNAGNLAGTMACLLGLLFFGANSFCARRLQLLWEKRPGRFLICFGTGVVCLCAVLAILISGLMLHAMYDTPKQENVVVVLGCKVRNGVPSLMLQRRLEAAYDYLVQHPDVPVIVCGGQGPDESISEAQCMYEYLTAKGIEEGRILLDDRSVSTYENLQNAKEYLVSHQLGSTITIVTDGFHQYRASMIADSLDLSCDHISAKTSWYLVPAYWIREWLGVCYQFVFG